MNIIFFSIEVLLFVIWDLWETAWAAKRLRWRVVRWVRAGFCFAGMMLMGAVGAVAFVLMIWR